VREVEVVFCFLLRSNAVGGQKKEEERKRSFIDCASFYCLLHSYSTGFQNADYNSGVTPEHLPEKGISTRMST
jgi:hypothetical protein